MHADLTEHGRTQQQSPPRVHPGEQSERHHNACHQRQNQELRNIGGITGSDEVWFNPGDQRYYTGSSRQIGGAALGVIDSTSVLIESIPQGSGSHSVAADCKKNHIFVPQVAPLSVVGLGGDTTGVSAGICGGNAGCVAVYRHHHENESCGIADDDHDEGHHHH